MRGIAALVLGRTFVTADLIFQSFFCENMNGARLVYLSWFMRLSVPPTAAIQVLRTSGLQVISVIAKLMLYCFVLRSRVVFRAKSRLVDHCGYV